MTTPYFPYDNVNSTSQTGVEAVVTIGNVTDGGDILGKFVADNKGIFTDWMIYNRYEKDGHIYMMPITSPGGFQGASVAFVQLASPTLLWICDWTASRFGSQPQVPDPTPADPLWVLLDKHHELAPIVVGADGVTPLYRITGPYIYGHRVPAANMLDNMNYPKAPWLDDSIPRTIDKTTLTKNLIDVTGAGLINKPRLQ